MNDDADVTAKAVRHVRCAVCDGTGEELEAEGEERLCRCGNCGLRFVNPRTSKGYLALQRDKLFGNAMLKRHGAEIKNESKNAVEVMKSFFMHLQGKPAARNGFGRNVLDVQCELGFRLREFQKYGWNADGIETSKNAIEYATACAIDVREGWFDALTYPSKFDLVLFWEIFGDLPDPKKAVGRLKEILKPTGLAFVRMPSDQEAHVLFHFDIDSLRRLFAQVGFEFVEEKEEDGCLSVWVRHKQARKRTPPKEEPKEVIDDAADSAGGSDSAGLRPSESGDTDDGTSGL